MGVPQSVKLKKELKYPLHREEGLGLLKILEKE
jgi:hypothetical protein